MPNATFAGETTRARRLVAVGLSLTLGARLAGAQTDKDHPPEPKIVVSFEHRTRVEGMTHPFRLDEAGPTRVLAFRTRLQVAFTGIPGPLGAFVELQDSRSSWNDSPFVVPARHVNHLDIKQAQLRLACGHLFGDEASGGITLGRFTLDVGRRRLVARNGMRNTTNAFDGVHGWLSTRDGSSFQAFVSSPVRLRPDELDRSDTARVFWGGSLTARRWRPLEAELYLMRLDESGDTLTGRRHTTFGGRMYRNPSPGALDFETELAWQRGLRADQVHGAFFAHLEAGFTFRRGRARASVLFDHASGDRDPADARSERFDTLFGARAFEYAPTGIYGPFFRANIQGSGARLTWTPAPRVEITAAHRALWLAEARDAWVGSDLQDPSGDSGRFLGHHLEAWVRWRPGRWLLVEAAYAHFFKGSFVDRVPGSPATPDSDYLTLGVGLAGPLFTR